MKGISEKFVLEIHVDQIRSLGKFLSRVRFRHVFPKMSIIGLNFIPAQAYYRVPYQPAGAPYCYFTRHFATPTMSAPGTN